MSENETTDSKTEPNGHNRESVTAANDSPLDQLKSQLQQPTWIGKNPPPVLYHYTSASGFHGIVSSGVLRGSHFAYLNDSTELLYGSRLAQGILDEYITKHGGTVEKIFTVAKAVLRVLDANQLSVYLACFCAVPDLLSQWRAYGSRGARYCIGFDAARLPGGSSPSYVMHGVNYDPKSQAQAIRKAIDLTIQACKQIDFDSDRAKQVNGLFTAHLFNLLASFKDPAFKEEREWRAAVSDFVQMHELHFAVVNGRLKPFINLWRGSEGDSDHLPIMQVTVGTEGLTDLSIKSAEMLLARYGYSDVTVKASRVPIREI